MTLIGIQNHSLKIKMRRDRIDHNLIEIKRLKDQNYILENEIEELSKLSL